MRLLRFAAVAVAFAAGATLPATADARVDDFKGKVKPTHADGADLGTGSITFRMSTKKVSAWYHEHDIRRVRITQNIRCHNTDPVEKLTLSLRRIELATLDQSGWRDARAGERIWRVFITRARPRKVQGSFTTSPRSSVQCEGRYAFTARRR